VNSFNFLATIAGNTVSQGIKPFIADLSTVALAICSLFLVVGGYIFITSSGNPERLLQAKKIIKNALIGLVIVISAFTLSSILSNSYSQNSAHDSATGIQPITPIKATSNSTLTGVLLKTITAVIGSIVGTIAIPFIKALSYFTSSTPLLAANSSVFDLWLSVVAIADALFALVLILLGLHVMSYSALGLQELNLRQLLPKVIIGFLFINSSLFVIDSMIGLSNILVKAISNGKAVNDLWNSLSDILNHPSAYGIAALIIMLIFLIFSVILIIYYVGRIVTIYLGAVLAPLIILCLVLPVTRDFAVVAIKRYVAVIFVIFVHVIIIELASSILSGMAASGKNNLDPLMSMVIGLATLIALLKTQGVMTQLSYATVGPKTARMVGERMLLGVSYLGSQAARSLSVASSLKAPISLASNGMSFGGSNTDFNQKSESGAQKINHKVKK
jgi:hypothetical protein